MTWGAPIRNVMVGPSRRWEGGPGDGRGVDHGAMGNRSAACDSKGTGERNELGTGGWATRAERAPDRAALRACTSERGQRRGARAARQALQPGLRRRARGTYAGNTARSALGRIRADVRSRQVGLDARDRRWARNAAAV